MRSTKSTTAIPQGGLVSVLDDYDVALLEPNSLYAGCDHLAIPVGIGQRADLARVRSIANDEGQPRLAIGAQATTLKNVPPSRLVQSQSIQSQS
jgi:hypothetical protein